MALDIRARPGFSTGMTIWVKVISVSGAIPEIYGPLSGVGRPAACRLNQRFAGPLRKWDV